MMYGSEALQFMMVIALTLAVGIGLAVGFYLILKAFFHRR